MTKPSITRNPKFAFQGVHPPPRRPPAGSRKDAPRVSAHRYSSTPPRLRGRGRRPRPRARNLRRRGRPRERRRIRQPRSVHGHLDHPDASRRADVLCQPGGQLPHHQARRHGPGRPRRRQQHPAQRRLAAGHLHRQVRLHLDRSPELPELVQDERILRHLGAGRALQRALRRGWTGSGLLAPEHPRREGRQRERLSLGAELRRARRSDVHDRQRDVDLDSARPRPAVRTRRRRPRPPAMPSPTVRRPRSSRTRCRACSTRQEPPACALCR